MKKFILMLVTLAMLCGCAKMPLIDIPEIEDCVWVMHTVQDANKSGDIIACDKSLSETYPEAWELEVILKASGGVLEIYDRTNNLRFNIEYELAKNDYEVRNYSLLGNEGGGYAILGKQKFANEEEKDVLILALDDYVLNFRKK